MKRMHILMLLAAALAVVLLMPVETKLSLAQTWRQLRQEPGQMCFDYIKQSLKDPHSALLDSAWTNPQTSDVTIIYKAKNSYGAYTRGEAQCVVKSGAVDERLTQLLKESERLRTETAKHERRVECLNKQISLQKAGKSLAEAKAEVNCPEDGN